MELISWGMIRAEYHNYNAYLEQWKTSFEMVPDRSSLTCANLTSPVGAPPPEISGFSGPQNANRVEGVNT
jgi:hypothetical protein